MIFPVASGRFREHSLRMLRSIDVRAILKMLALAACAVVAPAPRLHAQDPPVGAPPLQSIPFDDADGKTRSLKDYDGKVVLIVNVASRCGLTKQYKALEEMHRKYRERGLVILGFPCNDFGGQEPGTIEEIKEFCSSQYDVTFPLMAKVQVKGEGRHALYEALCGPKGAFPGEVKWNFGKFLIGRDGKPLGRFEPTVTPDAKALVEAVEAALGAQVP